MSKHKIFSGINAVVTLAIIGGWFVMRSPEVVMYAAFAYVLLLLVQLLARVITLPGVALDLLLFGIGYLVGKLTGTAPWIMGCVVFAIWEFLVSIIDVSTNR